MTTLKDKIRDLIVNYGGGAEDEETDYESLVEEIMDEIKDWIR